MPAATEAQMTKKPWSAMRPHWGVILLVVVSYIPLLLTKPGKVGADTKTYLYLDPGRLLSRAPFMWDPNIGLGTVTHQNIGYLWPMGPYYFVMDAIGLPDWVAQRIWLGSILFAAGMGVRWMLRELNWQGAGVTVASLTYALSPYVLEYAARISVILLPFAGLPWLIGLSVRCLRRKDWKSPAIFALVTLTVGGVNATSLILVMVGPVLWFIYATFILREVRLSETMRAGLKITVLTFITSLWWLAGLMIQGTYGIPILRYTETYKTVADAALGTELLRGLGYWFFYGQDGLGPWTASSITYVQAKISVLISFLIPGLGLLSGLATKWKTRLYFALLITAGLVIGVGSHPWESPSPYGSVFKAWSRSDLGLSFRSTPRAAPLIILGLAVFLGSGVAALARWRPQLHRPVAAGMLVLILLNMVPLFRGQLVDRNLQRNEAVPEYWTQAADKLTDGDHKTRVLEFPGIDFAAYRWGNTVDPITPGLTDREFVARELIPYGTPPSANLLNAIDAPFQAGRADPSTLAPLARLMGIGDIVFRADLQYERYLTPRPRETWTQLLNAQGLGQPAMFGPQKRNNTTPSQPVDDTRNFAIPIGAEDPPPVSVFPVESPEPMLRTVGSKSPVLLSGDGDGVVAMAAAGKLDPSNPLFYSSSFASNPKALKELVDTAGSTLVVTDTNRRQARRWGSVRENTGYTERAGETALIKDLTDNRLNIFPDAGDSSMTVSEQIGGARLSASGYGNEVTYTPGDRAMNAMDGDEATAWRAAAFAKAEGAFLEVDLHEPVSTDHFEILQGQGAKNRWMTSVLISFDGSKAMRVELNESSRSAPGQRITFPTRTFSHVRITVDGTDIGPQPTYRGISDVGIAELRIPGVESVREVIRPPVAMMDLLGAKTKQHPLSYIFTRRAPNQADVLAADEEPAMYRRLKVPVEREFSLTGKGRLAVNRTDQQIDEFLGLAAASGGGISATSSARMPGSIGTRARSAVDGNPLTAYISPLNHPLQQLVIEYPRAVSIESLELTAMIGDKYSVPTKVALEVDGNKIGSFEAGEPKRLKVSVLDDPADAMARIGFDTGTISGQRFVISLEAVQERHSKDWFSGTPTLMPVAINEINLPSGKSPDPQSLFDSGCRNDLLAVDNHPVPLRVTGSFGAASNGEIMSATGCTDQESTAIAAVAAVDSPTRTPSVLVPKGEVDVVTSRGTATGFDLDLLMLDSASGGSPAPTGAGEASARDRQDRFGPRTRSTRTGRLSYEVKVRDADEPYWLILGQSQSAGWTARTRDGVDLGKPVLINGFANGWQIDPKTHGQNATIELRWTPQRFIWLGLGLSSLGVIICLALALWPKSGGDRRWARSTVAPEFRDLATSVQNPPDHTTRAGTTQLSRRAMVISVALAGAGGLFFGGIYVAATTALATLVACTFNAGRWVVRGVSLALFAGAFGVVILKEALRSYPIDFKWVSHFEITHAWSLAATFLMVVSVAVDAVIDRSERLTTEPTSDTEAP